MAFTIDSFDNVTSGMSRGPKIWSYGSTTDTLAQTMVAGYFEEVKDRLYKNDLIYVSSIDDVELIKITSENGQTPTTSIFVPASGGAPSDATYITQTPNIDLANEQALSLLASGLLKSQTVTGVISVATPNVDYQVGSPALTSISGLTTAADEMIYTTASNTYATTGLTAAGRALLDDPTAGDQRNSLGLGTIATQNSNNVTITGGSITGITDLAIADGGTAASTNTAAINNLVSGAALTTATVASTDLLLIQDASDSNNLKSVTVQSVTDLTPASVNSGTANQIAYYATTGAVVSGLTGGVGTVLVTNDTGVPSMLANPGISGKALLSQNVDIPVWSTSTFPGAVSQNAILFGNTANSISSFVSVVRSGLTTDSSGVPTWIPLTNGQIVVGSTSGSPAAATITAGTGIGVTSASNAITIATSSAVPLAVTVPFTAAQWNAMYATPVQLVAAPGSGLCHIVISCAIFFNYGGTNQFANGGAVVLQWGTAANGAGNSPINTMAATNFTGVADSLTMQTVVAKSNVAKVNFDNLSLCLSNQTAAFTVGTNNTLNVVVSYYTVASGW